MPLTDKQLRDVASEAARGLFPSEHIGSISASLGTTHADDDAYFFELRLDQAGDREEAARVRIALRQAIRDRLVAAGDETYPFVRVLSRRPAIA